MSSVRRKSATFLAQFFVEKGVAGGGGGDDGAKARVPATPPATSALWVEKRDPRSKRTFYTHKGKSIYAGDRAELGSILRKEPLQTPGADGARSGELPSSASGGDGITSPPKRRAARATRRALSVNPASMTRANVDAVLRGGLLHSPRDALRSPPSQPSWQQLWDPKSARHYFYNAVTQSSVWAAPSVSTVEVSPRSTAPDARKALPAANGSLEWSNEVLALSTAVNDEVLAALLPQWGERKVRALCASMPAPRVASIARGWDADALRGVLAHPELPAATLLACVCAWKARVADEALLRDVAPTALARVLFTASHDFTSSPTSSQKLAASDVAAVLEPLRRSTITRVLSKLPASVVTSIVRSWSGSFVAELAAEALSSSCCPARWGESLIRAHATPIRSAPPASAGPGSDSSDDGEY